MRRVLHVMSSLERSGMEKMLLSSSEEWTNSGYSCGVLATAASVGALAPQMREAGYEVFHIPFRSRFRYLLRARFVTGYLKLCRSGFDVVHIHTEAATLVFAILARLAGISNVVLTPHNTFRFSGLLRARKIVERTLIRLLGGRYGMISEGVLKCEWENFRNPGVRTWNWFDTEHFRPPTQTEKGNARRSLGCKPDQFVTVSVGNCNQIKNHPEILRAIPLLPASLDSAYLHVGKEPDDQYERKLAAELHIESKVSFHGTQDDVRQFLWAADAFVMPSLHEGFSIAVMEAIACGLTAVIANVEGLRDIAAIAESTILTSTTAESIAAGIAQAAALPIEERTRLALADSERIRTQFSIENGVRSIVEGLYREAAPTEWFERREGTVH